MKIRSITLFMNPHWPLRDEKLRDAQEFVRLARPAFEAAGYVVQSTRLATIPFHHLAPLADTRELIRIAQAIEKAASQSGYNYVSLGPALPTHLESYASIPEMLEETQNVFLAGMMTTGDGGISLPAVRACAGVIHRVAALSVDGFANLRFAALANVPPGAPFFPAAYHLGDHPAFALATEAADLAVRAFRNAATLEGARQELISSIERHAQALTRVADELGRLTAISFNGIDFTLAPFPEEELSFGTALESLGVPAVGLHGTLAAAALVTDALDRASFPRAGFNGLMLPVLEDATLAKRAAEGKLTVKDLLLYASVCGTGLDTVPLPGETTVEQLFALLVDLATLAQRLDKPLTARLMPIPGKQAGDPTGFDFAYFANSRVLPLEAEPLRGGFAGGETIPISRRSALQGSPEP